MNNPKLTLVGAGPGDPDLITLKALNVLKNAKVVLYDALINDSILNYCNEEVEKIFVGKQKGVCQFPQEDINKLIVLKAFEKGHVVRLKGGDPFIFGRGHEEMQYAIDHNVEVDIIPGVSSFYAVPELNFIPLTRRGVNESFWVTTGTTKDHKISEDIKSAIKTNATIVILMGMHVLDQIVALFTLENKTHLPICIIQNGSTNKQKIVKSDIRNILHIVEKENISSPAVIVIGEVVQLNSK